MSNMLFITCNIDHKDKHWLHWVHRVNRRFCGNAAEAMRATRRPET